MESINRSLTKIVGKQNVLTNKAARIRYSYTATPSSIQLEMAPPGWSQEISSIMNPANQEPVPAFPRHAGSGFPGGGLPTAGENVFGLNRLDKILEINEESRYEVFS